MFLPVLEMGGLTKTENVLTGTFFLWPKRRIPVGFQRQKASEQVRARVCGLVGLGDTFNVYVFMYSYWTR